MPSKKQRAKKPNSQAAQEKAATEAMSPRHSVWATAEDEAANWIQRQLQCERESAFRGRTDTPPVSSRDESPTGDRAVKGHESTRKEKSSGGGLKQHAVAGTVEVGEDKMHDAPAEMKVHTTAYRSGAAHDVMNTLTTPVRHNDESEVKSERKTAMSQSVSTSMDTGQIAMKGLLKEHGLATVPTEWNTPMGKLLLKEVLQARVNKLKKARAQRERRKGRRNTKE